MDKKKQEEINGQKNRNEFNSVTEKKKPENQNQEHNARKEAFDVKMRQVQAGPEKKEKQKARTVSAVRASGCFYSYLKE